MVGCQLGSAARVPWSCMNISQWLQEEEDILFCSRPSKPLRRGLSVRASKQNLNSLSNKRKQGERGRSMPTTNAWTEKDKEPVYKMVQDAGFPMLSVFKMKAFTPKLLALVSAACLCLCFSNIPHSKHTHTHTNTNTHARMHAPQTHTHILLPFSPSHNIHTYILPSQLINKKVGLRKGFQHLSPLDVELINTVTSATNMCEM